MITGYDFFLQTQLVHGVGISSRIPDMMREKGFRNVAVLVDEGVAKHSAYYGEILSLIREAAQECWVCELRGSEEPDYDYLDEVAAQFRPREVDLFIGIGGGSCLDTTKGVAVLQTNPGHGIEYRGFDLVKEPGVPTMLIPTTAGTGSEVTINAVFTNKAEKRKLGINGNYMNATYGLLDAKWVVSCPFDAALSSGMDALVHALESFMTEKRTVFTRALSREAFKLLYENLPCLVDDKGNEAMQQNLLYGSWLAAAALFNAGSSVAGALSYPLGVHYKVPHGIGGGIFIKSVVAYNVERGYHEFHELLDLIAQHGLTDPGEKSRLFVEKLEELYARLGVPSVLTRWGITAANVEEAGALLPPFQAAMDQNPVPFKAETDGLDMLKAHVE